LQTKPYGARMPTMRESWTDERLDDLNVKVDRGFDRVDARFDRLETDIDARFDKIDARFENLNQILFGFAGVMIVTLAAAQF
jgi:hypothetical protein